MDDVIKCYIDRFYYVYSSFCTEHCAYFSFQQSSSRAFRLLPTCLFRSVNLLFLPFSLIRLSTEQYPVLLASRLIWKLQACSFSLSDLFQVKLQFTAFIKMEYNFHPTMTLRGTTFLLFVVSILVNCGNCIFFLSKITFAHHEDRVVLYHTSCHVCWGSYLVKINH